MKNAKHLVPADPQKSKVPLNSDRLEIRGEYGVPDFL